MSEFAMSTLTPCDPLTRLSDSGMLLSVFIITCICVE